jgi:hypothetical protein
VKVTMKTQYATPERAIGPGQSADLPDAEARDLIDKGFAVAAEAEADAPASTRKRRSSE